MEKADLDDYTAVNHLYGYGMHWRPERDWEPELSKLDDKTRGYWLARELVYSTIPLMRHVVNEQIMGRTGVSMPQAQVVMMAKAASQVLEPKARTIIKYLQDGDGDDKELLMMGQASISQEERKAISDKIDKEWARLGPSWDEEGNPIGLRDPLVMF